MPERLQAFAGRDLFVELSMQQTKERTAAEPIVQPATYATILTHVEPGAASSRRVAAAARLAEDVGARLIGLGAEALDIHPASDPYMGYAAGDWIALVQEQIETNLKSAEASFRRDAGGADIEWRSVQDYPHRALTRMSRAADLIVMSPRHSGGASRTADPADVVMTAGRPVLLAPDQRRHLSARAVVVAWKDTRECRRAISDAMPLLKRAEDVIVLAACKPDEVEQAAFEVGDVVANLKRHGVAARPLVNAAAPEGVMGEIGRVAHLNTADLIVCGAYGHSRVREWAFGGVTEDLIHRPPCFVLMSH